MSFSSNIAFIHTLLACLALLTGLIVVLGIKGTKLHRYLGYLYFASMLSLNVTALFVHGLYTFGAFHWLALFSLAGVLSGMAYPIFFRHRSNWLRMHSDFMLWSYIGLVAALVAESITRVPVIRNAIVNREIFWYLVTASSLAVMVFGGYLMELKRTTYLIKADRL